MNISPTKAFYVNIDQIIPGQNRYSEQTVLKKESKIRKRSHPLKFDGDRSAYSLKNFVPVIKVGEAYVLVDGHHDVLASLKVGAKSIPVKVINNFEHLSLSEFWTQAKLTSWAHPYDIDGKFKEPTDFNQMTNDPNRDFASRTACKLPSFLNAKIYSPFVKLTGKLLKDKLWVKVGKDIPFIELKIADIMRKNNLIYSKELQRDTAKYKEFKESVRQALKADPIEGIKLL